MTEETQQMNDPLASLPEKFRDAETGEVRLEALVKSYCELEKKLSSMPAPPAVPASPDDYEIDVSHGLFAIDPEVNGRLHAKGFTAEQVQEVYALAAEKLVPAILELTQEFQADREVERLVAAFGGPEKWQEVSRQLLAFGKKNLPPDVLTNLSSSFEGVMALHRLMKGQEPGIAVREADSAATSEGDLRSLMRDPRYWREKDPAFVAKVTDGFRRMYGQG